jgi:hypothetical protein
VQTHCCGQDVCGHVFTHLKWHVSSCFVHMSVLPLANKTPQVLNSLRRDGYMRQEEGDDEGNDWNLWKCCCVSLLTSIRCAAMPMQP